MSRRRAVILTGCLLAAGLVAFLLASSDPFGANAPEDTPGAEDPKLEDAMRASGPEDAGGDEPELARAALEGSRNDAAASGRSVAVTVVDRGGRPMAEMRVQLDRYLDGKKESGTSGITDEDGLVRFHDVRLGHARVSVYSGHSSIYNGIVAKDVLVTKSSTVITAQRARHVRRKFVDAETGRALKVETAQCWDDVLGSRVYVRTPASELRAYDLEDRAGRSAFRTTVVAPPGYVAWDRELWSQPLSEYAHSCEVTVPLRREAIVRLAVLAHDGTPAEDAVIGMASVAGKNLSVSSETMRDGFGTLHVKGIPFFRREPVAFWVHIPGTTAFKWFYAPLPSHVGVALEGTIRLPKPEPLDDEFEGPENNSTIGIGGGGAGGAFRGRTAGKRGRAEVRVLRHDGAPAVGARVKIRHFMSRTDARGVARFDAVPAGKSKVVIEQRGLLPTAGEIEITGGALARAELREGLGATIDLQVVDDRGEPLPFARFVFLVPGSRAQYIDEQGGVQRIDRYVDHRGRRTLTRVDPAVQSIKVYWASRVREVALKLSHGKRTPVRVALSAADDGTGR